MSSIQNKLIVATCLLTSLLSSTAFASFKVCNKRSSPMWVVYARYVSSTSKIYTETGIYGLYGGCYYSSWKTTGWYYAEPGTCATVYGSSITNRYSYVRAEFDDGAVLSGSTSFYIQDDAFSWDEYTTAHYTSDDCIGSTAASDFVDPDGWWAGFYKVDSGSATSYTLNIY